MAQWYKKRRTNCKKEVVTFLIVCEGQKTERIYFNKYRQRNSGLKIETPGSSVTDPNSLVDFTRSQIKKYNIDFNSGDQAWCVFDADQNSEENIERAKKLAIAENIKLCLSNPCFELWYILHFRYFDQRISTSELQDEIKSHIPNYDKVKDYFDTLLSKRNSAIKNANKLNCKHSELISISSNPSTQVVELVKEMLKIIENNQKK